MNKLNSIVAFVSKPRNGLALLLTINLLLHLPFFNLPPQAAHVWRQCNTLAVARNFYEEGMDITHPRVDRRGTSDGVTGMQFPIYEYGLACIYKVTGEHFWVHRVYSFIISCLGLVFFYLLLNRVFNNPFLAFAGAWGLCWSAEIYYHGINALPDILALTLSITGLYYFVSWRQNRSIAQLIASLACITMAGLTKLQFLVVGLPMAYVVLRDLSAKKPSLSWLLIMMVYGAIAVGIPLLWYNHANDMIARSGLADFGLHTEKAGSTAELFDIFKHNFISDLPEVLLNYAGTVFFVLGIYAFFKSKEMCRKYLIPALLWLAGFTVFYIMLSARFRHHAYYFIAIIPFLFVAVAIGANWLKEKQKPVALSILLLVLFAQPVLAMVRIVPARWSAGRERVPLELYNEEPRKALQNAIPDNAVCITGPDPSGCIYYYFLHKKGFGFDTYQALTQPSGNYPTTLDKVIAQGAEYLITDNDSVVNDAVLKQHYNRVVGQQGKFIIIELK